MDDVYLHVWSGLWSRAPGLPVLIGLPVGRALVSGRGAAVVVGLRQDGQERQGSRLLGRPRRYDGGAHWSS